MEEQKTKIFSGDSFGNLDRSNAEPGMETEIAVATDAKEERPQYKPHELKDNISVVALNPFLRAPLDDTKPIGGKLDNQCASETQKKSEKLPPASDFEDSPSTFTTGEPTESEHLALDESQLREYVDGHKADSVLPVSEEHGKYPLEDDDAQIQNNYAMDDEVGEINEQTGDSQEVTKFEHGGSTSRTYQGGSTSRTYFSDPLVENEPEIETGRDIEAVADDEGNIDGDGDPSDEDADGEEEGSECLLLETSTRPQTRSTLREVPGGMRAKANTPASLYTTTVEGLDSPGTPQAVHVDSVRGASRGSRDEVFQRAMTLMSNRCTSARGEQEELFSDREPPFGIHIPQYFYVHQTKPSPMSPLKVWRGYKGNVYFEPINVSRINSAHGNTYSSQLDRVASEQARHSVASSAGVRQGNPSSRGPTTPLTRATTAASGQTSRPYRYIEPLPSSAPHVFVMDKQAVVESLRAGGANGGKNSSEAKRDLHFIEGMESTGSLAVRPMSGSLVIGARETCTVTKGGGHRNDRKLLFRRDRLCKGPNFSAMDRRGKEVSNERPGTNCRKSSTHSTVLTSPRTSSRISAYRPGSRSAGPGVRPHRTSLTFPESQLKLVVSGDKFAPPTVMSPLLRSNGQFTLGGGTDEEGASGHRAAANSPDLLDARGMMISMAMSTPLDPLRISMPRPNSPSFDHDGIRNARTVNGASQSRTGRGRWEGSRPLTCSGELKPFIKYSHDVRVNYERNNANFC